MSYISTSESHGIRFFIVPITLFPPVRSGTYLRLFLPRRLIPTLLFRPAGNVLSHVKLWRAWELNRRSMVFRTIALTTFANSPLVDEYYALIRGCASVPILGSESHFLTCAIYNANTISPYPSHCNQIHVRPKCGLLLANPNLYILDFFLRDIVDLVGIEPASYNLPDRIINNTLQEWLELDQHQRFWRPLFYR